MKTIKIKNKKGVVFDVLVDDEDYDLVQSYTWYVIKNKNTHYAKREIWCKNKRVGELRMHRLIMNPPSCMVIDHIDHNGLNNQKSNLRICTNNENNRNRLPSGRSKYLGVSPRVCSRSHTLKDGTIKTYTYFSGYVAMIKCDGKQKYLGLFSNEIDAAKRYNEVASKMFGEFANLNKI